MIFCQYPLKTPPRLNHYVDIIYHANFIDITFRPDAHQVDAICKCNKPKTVIISGETANE